MQPNQQSFNIFFVESHPVAHSNRYQSCVGQFFYHENFIILKVVKNRNKKLIPIIDNWFSIQARNYETL